MTSIPASESRGQPRSLGRIGPTNGVRLPAAGRILRGRQVSSNHEPRAREELVGVLQDVRGGIGLRVRRIAPAEDLAMRIRVWGRSAYR